MTAPANYEPEPEDPSPRRRRKAAGRDNTLVIVGIAAVALVLVAAAVIAVVLSQNKGSRHTPKAEVPPAADPPARAEPPAPKPKPKESVKPVTTPAGPTDWFAALKEPEPRRTQAVEALARRGKAAVPELVSVLEGGDPDAAPAAARALALIGPTAADTTPALSAALDRDRVRGPAATALAGIGGTTTVPKMAALIQADVPERRELAAAVEKLLPAAGVPCRKLVQVSEDAAKLAAAEDAERARHKAAEAAKDAEGMRKATAALAELAAKKAKLADEADAATRDILTAVRSANLSSLAAGRVQPLG